MIIYQKLEIRSKHFMMLVLVILNLVKVQQLFLVEKLKELRPRQNVRPKRYFFIFHKKSPPETGGRHKGPTIASLIVVRLLKN